MIRKLNEGKHCQRMFVKKVSELTYQHCKSKRGVKVIEREKLKLFERK